MDSIIQFANDISEFINSGLYEFITEVLAELIIYLTVSAIQAKIFFTSIAWGVAQEILTSLNISQYIQSAWNGIPPDSLQVLNFFRVPDALNIILNASVTKYAMNVLGI